MKRSERAYPALDEKIVTYEHPSGLHVQVIPKPGFYKKFAVCSVNFGSVDTRFILPGEQKITTVPDGVAHFLEHKLFEQPDMNVMDQYLALGASRTRPPVSCGRTIILHVPAILRSASGC